MHEIVICTFFQGSPVMHLVPFDPPLSAFDQDLGIDTPLTYSILSGNSDGYFSIDTATGLVYQTTEIDREELVRRKRLDKEANIVFRMEVEAQQADNPLKAATTRVEITLDDVNDNVPLFKRNEYNVTLRENAHRGKRVMAVQAADADKVSARARTCLARNHLQLLLDTS